MKGVLLFNMITKELFIESIESVRQSDDYQVWLNKQLRNNGAEGYLFQPNCVDALIRLLNFCLKEYDSDDIISYFCFELEFGRKWKPGMVIDENGNDVELSSSEHLYDYIISPKNKEVFSLASLD